MYKKALNTFLAGMLAMTTNCAAADFNEVGKQASIMLQNRHYAHNELVFDKKLSARFFDMYLDELDEGRLFLTQEDITDLSEKYRERLHAMLLQKKSMDAANEIYEVYKKRVQQRITYAYELIDKADYKFDSDREVNRSREDSDWFASEEEAEKYWQNLIEDSFLAETLRREKIEKLSLEKGNDSILKNEKPMKEKISLRYKRILNSVVKVDEEDIANYFFSAIAQSYDPHTDYFSAREYDQFRINIGTGLVGIGAQLSSSDDGATKISGIVINGPADKHGELKLNDKIIGVDSKNDGEVTDIMFMSLDKVVTLIRGELDKPVRLKVEPAGGGEVKFITIVRGQVEMKDEQAKAQIIDRKLSDDKTQRLAVLTLPSFYADFGDRDGAFCSIHVENLLKRLNKEKVEGLIFDLRGNGGGSLEEVRRMTGFFTGDGPVVQVKNHKGQIRVQDSDGHAAIWTKPMVVLIDKTSASASEILAGALQDYNRAVIVGDSSTFGKGTVQQPIAVQNFMPFGSDRSRAGHLKPTIQKFYRAAGSSTQMKGVEADIIVPSVLEGYEVGEKYEEHALPHDEIRAAKGLVKLPKEDLHITELAKNSKIRMDSSQDFTYVFEDIDRMKELLKKKTISLNIKKRKEESLAVQEKVKIRNKERIERFEKIRVKDRESFVFYRLSLDDLKKDELMIEDLDADGDGHMRRTKDEEQDLDETPEWPSRIDAVKREGISILSDLVELSGSKKLAEVE